MGSMTRPVPALSPSEGGHRRRARSGRASGWTSGPPPPVPGNPFSGRGAGSPFVTPSGATGSSVPGFSCVGFSTFPGRSGTCRRAGHPRSYRIESARPCRCRNRRRLIRRNSRLQSMSSSPPGGTSSQSSSRSTKASVVDCSCGTFSPTSSVTMTRPELGSPVGSGADVDPGVGPMRERTAAGSTSPTSGAPMGATPPVSGDDGSRSHSPAAGS